MINSILSVEELRACTINPGSQAKVARLKRFDGKEENKREEEKEKSDGVKQGRKEGRRLFVLDHY
jgi:hypothetical protein